VIPPRADGGGSDHWVFRRRPGRDTAPLAERFLARLPLIVGDTALRRLALEDLEPFFAYRSDADAARFQGWAPMWRADAHRFLQRESVRERLRPGGWVQLAVCAAVSEKLLGDVGLFLDDDGGGAEVGFTLCPAARGRGHATRAVCGAVMLVFETTAAQTVRGVVDARNAASRRVLERAGFALLRRRRLPRLHGGDVTELRFVCERGREASADGR
jgi:RimJ/RimL family protein N-acetyltransferase